MPAVALVAVFNSEGKLLLGKRQDNELWTIPGGHLNEGEVPEEAARREVKEESGLDLMSLSFLKEQVNDNGTTLYCFSGYASGNPVVHSKNDPDDEVGEDGWKWVDIAGGLEPRYYNNLHGPETAEDGNLLKQLFDLKEKKESKSDLKKAEDEVTRLLQHHDPSERLMGLKLNTLTPDHLDLAAHDQDPNIWRAAIDHPLFDEDAGLRFMTSQKNPLEQQSYLLSKPERAKSHFLDAMWRNATNLLPEQRSKVIDLIAINPLAESTLIRVIYLSASTNGMQRSLLLGHPNCPEDVLQYAIQLMLIVPTKESFELASIAVKNPKAPVDFLGSLIKLAVEQPTNFFVNTLAETAMAHSIFADALLDYLIVQNKLRPGSNVAVLIACGLSGPMGNPFNINKIFKEVGPDLWSGEKSPIPNGITEAQMDSLVQYAIQKDNKVLLSRLMDNKSFTGRHLDIIFRNSQQNLLAS